MAGRLVPQATSAAHRLQDPWRSQPVVATPGRLLAMGKRKRNSDRAGRAPLWSPGRPGAGLREERQRFWTAIAAGRSSEVAAAKVGVSPSVGARWFQKAGGMPPTNLASSAKPLSGRPLSFAEREELALMRAQGCGVREAARPLGRAASTISRELRRNAARAAASWSTGPAPRSGTPNA